MSRRQLSGRSSSKTLPPIGGCKPSGKPGGAHHHHQHQQQQQQLHPSERFLAKCRQEKARLKSAADRQFRDQLLKLFRSEQFADLTIECGRRLVKVHETLLLARVPSFYSYLRVFGHPNKRRRSIITIPDIGADRLIKFIEDVYSKDDLKDSEIDLIERINQFEGYKMESGDKDLVDAAERNQVELEDKKLQTDEGIEEGEKQDGEDKDEQDKEHQNQEEIKETENKVQKSPEQVKQRKQSNEDETGDGEIEANESCDREGDDGADGDDEAEADASSRIHSDDEEDEANLKEDQQSVSSSMIRSSTFDMLCSLNDDQELDTSKDKLKRNVKSSICLGTSNDDDKEKTSQGKNLITKSDSSSLFQFYIDMDKIEKKEQPPEETPMNKSDGFMFIEFDQEKPKRKSPSKKSKSPEDQLPPIKFVEAKKSSPEQLKIKDFDDDDEFQNTDFIGIDNIEYTMINQTLSNCSRLGEDLLKMLETGTNSDVIIQVESRQIKAHKCILASRSVYFESMFRGTWKESRQERVDLRGFTYPSVFFALCHIYGGVVDLPDPSTPDTTPSPDLIELALLSDLLSLDGLKEAVLNQLSMHYCHYFHKPCRDCIDGVCQCLAISRRCASLDLLHNKCIEWTARHFAMVWPNKAFIQLDPDTVEESLAKALQLMNAETVIDTILAGEKIVSSAALPCAKWTQPVFGLIARLIDGSVDFVADNYHLVVASKAFISLGRGKSWNISTLEESLLAAMTKLTPDVACKTLVQLNNILLLNRIEDDDDDDDDDLRPGFGYGPFTDDFVKLTHKMRRHCERYMIQNAGHVTTCQSWSLIGEESRQRIKDAAVLVIEFEKATAPPPKLTSQISGRKSSDEDPKKSPIKRLVPKRPTAASHSRTPAVIKPKSGSRKATTPSHIKSEPKPAPSHFYDAVDPDEPEPSSVQVKEPIRNFRARQPMAKKSPVAKVTPLQAADRRPTNNNSNLSANAINDLVDQIDAETSLVTVCLQEAEQLEHELTRKLKKSSDRNSTGSRVGVASGRRLPVATRSVSRTRTTAKETYAKPSFRP